MTLHHSLQRELPFLIVLAWAICLSTGCQSTYLTAAHYRASVSALSSNSPQQALAQFPTGENGRFITDMEKVYLNILQGNPEIDVLREHAVSIDRRARYEVSEDLKAFFYADTPEGYYPSEHEIIWMHILLGWGYAMRGDMASARVEARRVGWLLDSPWSEEGHFDDPMLRILAASLWAMAGEWEDAAVDLRRAARLDESLLWAQTLGDAAQQPRHLVLVLGGIGPAPCWNPKQDYNLLRGLRHIEFKPQGVRRAVELTDRSGRNVPVFRSPDSSYWYVRHWQRNNAIRELVEDSRYGHTVLLSSARFAGMIGAGTVVGVSAGTLILGAGAGITYLSAEAGSGEGVLLGLAVMLAGPVYAYDLIRSTASESVGDLRQDLDVSGRYRFVRFLPEYVWVGWSREEILEPFDIRVTGGDAAPIQPFARSGDRVLLMYYPDSQPVSDDWKHNLMPSPDIRVVAE